MVARNNSAFFWCQMRRRQSGARCWQALALQGGRAASHCGVGTWRAWRRRGWLRGTCAAHKLPTSRCISLMFACGIAELQLCFVRHGTIAARRSPTSRSLTQQRMFPETRTPAMGEASRPSEALRSVESFQRQHTSVKAESVVLEKKRAATSLTFRSALQHVRPAADPWPLIALHENSGA